MKNYLIVASLFSLVSGVKASNLQDLQDEALGQHNRIFQSELATQRAILEDCNIALARLKNTFSPAILAKISPQTKTLLIRNNCSLTETNSIFIKEDIDQHRHIAIDLSSRIGGRSYFLGQVVETREFVACKQINNSVREEERALKDLRRFRAVVEKGGASYTVQELINGYPLSSQAFDKARNEWDSHKKARIALSFMEELQFCYEKKVEQTKDVDLNNTMYNDKTETVMLIDFLDGSSSPFINLDLEERVVSIKDQGIIYHIFGVWKAGHTLSFSESVGPYQDFLESLLSCQWSLTKGPNFVAKVNQLRELIQQNAH